VRVHIRKIIHIGMDCVKDLPITWESSAFRTPYSECTVKRPIWDLVV
jgi:hypothetical protein